MTRDTRDLKNVVGEYTTKGSFGLCLDTVLSQVLRFNARTNERQSVDGKLTASGHENGGVYVFNNETGRMLHSLSGSPLVLE